MKLIRPGATIGILGGGQLGRMLILAGRKMGYRFVVLDPTDDSPSGQVADSQITASFSDVNAAKQLASLSDVVTYEFENVDAEVAAQLESNAFVPQGSGLLKITQHRVREKTTLESMDIQVAPFRIITTEQDLRTAVAALGVPCVMKTATGGYDGKGQWVIRDEQQIPSAFAQAQQTGLELIVEQFISFDKELSVVVARNLQGEVKAFPVGENIHVENILHQTLVPARISQEQAEKAEKMALQVAEALKVVGLIAVEMFLTKDGDIFVNELAPRPHNSGHYTMEACITSQFEQHIRAVCGLPLGDTSVLTPVVMVNILGEHLDSVMSKIDELPSTAKLHLYGKAESRKKRKMGHVNFLSSSVEQAIEQIQQMGIW
ncbi:5-(carboxyamino)imidazole ribonucleotide synthase [Aneurinibacillus sp. Ricciae_BoGa-3]|uniref:5-(carboxyamino)imidazole ribonucleotide synthase n=1 Tax=Aneurinibacillus sp. Ricciae_BoGa-3 TaxID=3022697 RepID=UPI0023424B2D|nr:5-(carboxyamino)imidazole ribonucleotide synthase [Aneurinibacillus sp. Ricciae_BoGa-3]WCK54865.1 5-(carboxyamino)imidazole ribonucleotide synthase [Aneurinibacillus sp. Ricciae_BoGa-3]